MTVNGTYVRTVPTGDVWLYDFDKGVYDTLGGFVSNGKYYLHVDTVPPPPFPVGREAEHGDIGERGDLMPGVPMGFAASDERFLPFVYPMVVIRRESVTEAPQRWPSRGIQYRAPAPGAEPVTVNYSPTITLEGWSEYEQKPVAHPYDISYMISVLSTGEKAEQHAQAMLKHVMRTFQPRDSCGLRVRDSIGDTRLYEVFAEGPVSLREAMDLVEQQSGYSYTITVQAELDLRDPYFTKPATSLVFGWNNGVN